MKTPPRIASSEIADALFGDTTLFRRILSSYVPSLISCYGGETSLRRHLQAIPDRIICICPMVLCQAFLIDMHQEAPHNLLGPLGLAMYSISTHDDIVDERPEARDEVAGLLYSGNIASLHGISLLVSNGYADVVKTVIHLMNLNHCFQTDIISSIWEQPSDEEGYLKAISHTGYWAAIGTSAAAEYVASGIDEPQEVRDFALQFAQSYGRMCQVYDDVREIDNDLRNGYFSLPISIALERGYDLSVHSDRMRKRLRGQKRLPNRVFVISAHCVGADGQPFSGLRIGCMRLDGTSLQHERIRKILRGGSDLSHPVLLS